MASVCNDYLEDGSLGDLDQKFVSLTQTTGTISERDFNYLIEGFIYSECKDSIHIETYQVGSERVTVNYTSEDRCDGGNSFGSITDEDDEIIGYISDGDISCE